MGKYRLNESPTRADIIYRWIRTGDEVTINENGDLFVKDRIKVRITAEIK